MQAQPNEVLGNKDASNLMKIEYCGGWGYRKYAIELINKTEELFGADQFVYHLFMDAGVTGRFEVTVFPGSKDENDSGVLIHSKKNSGKYVSADWNGFFAGLEQAVSKWDILARCSERIKAYQHLTMNDCNWIRTQGLFEVGEVHYGSHQYDAWSLNRKERPVQIAKSQYIALRFESSWDSRSK